MANINYAFRSLRQSLPMSVRASNRSRPSFSSRMNTIAVIIKCFLYSI